MLKWMSRKLTRSWNGLASRLRRWGHWGLTSMLGLSVPLWLVELKQGFDAAGPLFTALAPIAAVVAGSAALAWAAGTMLPSVTRTSGGAAVSYDPTSRSLRFEHEKGQHQVPMADVTHARFYEPDAGQESGALHLETRGGHEWVLQMTPEDARVFLRATKLGPRRNVSRLQTTRVSSVLWYILGGLLFTPALMAATVYMASPLFYAQAAGWVDMANPSPILILATVILGMPVIGLTAVRGVGALLRPLLGESLEIGADGIAFGKWPSREFVAYRDIESINIPQLSIGSQNRSALVIRTHDGESHRIRLDAPEGDLGKTVRARLDAALKERDEVLVPRLERDGRDEEEWHEALAGLLKEAASYRQATLSKREVLKVLRNEMAPPEQRLGAAIALANTNDTEAKRILVQVSEATLDPSLRGPLVQIADTAKADIALEEEVLAAAGETAARA